MTRNRKLSYFDVRHRRRVREAESAWLVDLTAVIARYERATERGTRSAEGFVEFLAGPRDVRPAPAVTAEPPRCRDHGYVNPCDLCVRDHPPAAAVPEAEAGREATKRWAQTATPAEQDAYDRGLAVGRSAPAEEKCEDFDSQTDGRLAKWRAVNNAHYPPSSEPTKLRALMALADEEVAASAAAQERCHRCDHSKASHLGSEGPCLRDFCSCPEHLAGPRDDIPQADR